MEYYTARKGEFNKCHWQQAGIKLGMIILNKLSQRLKRPLYDLQVESHTKFINNLLNSTGALLNAYPYMGRELQRQAYTVTGQDAVHLHPTPKCKCTQLQ